MLKHWSIPALIHPFRSPQTHRTCIDIYWMYSCLSSVHEWLEPDVLRRWSWRSWCLRRWSWRCFCLACRPCWWESAPRIRCTNVVLPAATRPLHMRPAHVAMRDSCMDTTEVRGPVDIKTSVAWKLQDTWMMYKCWTKWLGHNGLTLVVIWSWCVSQSERKLLHWKFALDMKGDGNVHCQNMPYWETWVHWKSRSYVKSCWK